MVWRILGQRIGFRLASALGGVALLAAAALPAAAQQAQVIPERRVAIQDGADLPGNDLTMIRNMGESACVQACLADAACQALTWNGRAQACFLKSAAGAPQPFANAAAGVVLPADPAVLAGAERRLAAASWITADDRAQLAEQARSLGALYPGDGSDADGLRAMAAAAGEGADRIRWQGAATALTDAPADWAALAEAMNAAAGPEGGDRDADLRRTAASAALNAWLRDPDTGATAMLRLWARLAEEQDRGRDALSAIRAAAAATPDDAALAEERDGYENRHGFRVTDSRVDADGPDPRLCVSFSDPLPRGADLRPFVALPDPAMAVEVEGSDLCITGVPRGQRLAVTLRPGLPSAAGETLRRAVEQSQYIRDRDPMVRFAGRAYVLPATGDQGIAVSTVNAGQVDLTLYRMSDRNLVRVLHNGMFAAQLDEWKAEQFTGEIGDRVWSGQADVAPPAGGGAHPVNAEVTTRIDLRRAGLTLDPGVYVLNAAVPGQSPDRSPPATQWFMISDLGMTSWQGTDGLTVAVRGLSDAAARAGVEVSIVSRGNAVLGTALTDADGFARFDAGLTRGTDAAAPALVTAARREGGRIVDLAFLSLIDPEFDLSDRGVEGAPPAPPVDVMVALDRGAYRAGEVASATILARDGRAQALPDLPLTARILRPDGVEQARIMPAAAGAGGYVLTFPIPDTAPRGAWRIDVKLGEDEATLASARLLVEDFRPERIDFAAALPDGPLPAGSALDSAIDARWLFNAPAADLAVEGELRLTPARSLPGWEGYVFGREDDTSDPQVVAMPAGRTDAQGHFAAHVALPPDLAAAPRPWDATLTLSVLEGAGRPVERRVTRLVAPARAALGIRPDFEGGSVADGASAGFHVVALGPDLKPAAADAAWVLNRVETRYQWFATGGDWAWEPVTRRSRVDGGSLALGPDGPAALSAPVGWGQYELVVTATDGAETSMTFDAGWGASAAGSDTPDRLRVTLDRPAYRAGDTARVTLDAAADGMALVSVLSNRLIALRSVPVQAGRNTVDLPVTDDWDSGVYVAVSAVRPLSADAGHAPVRALGLAAAAVDPGDRALQATLSAPAEADPRAEATVSLAVAGAAPGQVVHATVWAVDQGILNLTAYRPPSATDHYFGQRRLGVGLRDLYGRLILPSGAADGTLRSGGDAASMQTQAPPPTERLMAWFSGPLTLGADGRVSVRVPLPDFNGSVRVMALAWTDHAIGQTDTTMLVRDPVVMTATVPAFLAPGDSAQASLRLTRASGPAGAVGLTAEAADGALGVADLPAEVALAPDQSVTLPLTLTAPDAAGIARLRLTAALADGRRVTKDLTIPVERQDAAVTRAMRVELAPGETRPLDLSPLGAFLPGTGRATLASGAFALLDAAGAIAELAAYPYGCSEQLGARIVPLLYQKGLAPDVPAFDVPGVRAGADGAGDTPDERGAAIDRMIAQVLTRQTPEGGFGLWSADAGDRWLDAWVTDVLSRARAAGRAVPEAAFRAALANLQNGLNAAADPQSADAAENAATAYAAYVLAREHAAVISDLRYYADTGGDAFATPFAAAQIGAALAAYGDQARADRLFGQAARQAAADGEPEKGYRADYGTRLRDLAGMLALAAEAGSRAVDATGTAAAIAAEIDRRGEAGLSTQEAAWITLAAEALSAGPGSGNGVTLNGAALPGPVADLGDAAAVPALTLGNAGAAAVPVTLSVTAAPVDPPRAGGTGFSITRRYFTADGSSVDPGRVAQGTRLVAVLEITPLDGRTGRLIVSDPLPAGFEIDNPDLLSQGDLAGLAWLEPTEGVDMTEFLQDRFAASMMQNDETPIRLAYRLRAVTPGRFAHPAATVADMYRPERRGWTDGGTTTIAP